MDQICEFLKQPPYPDIHRTVSIFVNYVRALIASQHPPSDDDADFPSLSESVDGQAPYPSGQDGPTNNSLAPSGMDPLDDASYRPAPPVQADKDPGMTSIPADRTATARPAPPRLPETMEAPNWTVSNTIADSFGLFEEGQNDIFDFLPMMPTMP